MCSIMFPISSDNFIFFQIGIELLYIVVLDSVVQQSELAICIHKYPLPWTSLSTPIPPSKSPKGTKQCSLHYTAGCYYLSVLHMVGYIHQTQSLKSPPPPKSTCLFSMSASLLFP